MFREIGSNFWQYKHPKIEKRNMECPYYGDNPVFFKSGRNATRALLKMLNVTAKRALLPLYTCQTVLDPFLEEGWQLFFYDVGADFSPCLDSLKATTQETEPAVILVMHYFGFQTVSRSVEDFLLLKKQQGCVIVEDVTQSLYSEHRLDFADYRVSSLRKFFAIPNGGFLSSDHPLTDIEKIVADKQVDTIAQMAFDTKEAYTQTMDPDQKTCFRGLYVQLQNMVAENGEIEDISPWSRKLLDEEDISSLKEKRVKNTKALINGLREAESVVVPLSQVDDQDAPLFLPVYTADPQVRSELQAHLAKHDIYCPIIWPVPEEIPLQGTKAERIYQRILCIPIDQRYTETDMNRVAACIKQFEK